MTFSCTVGPSGLRHYTCSNTNGTSETTTSTSKIVTLSSTGTVTHSLTCTNNLGVSSSAATTATTIESISCSVGSTICFPTFGCGHVIAYSGSNNEYVTVLRDSRIEIDSSYEYANYGNYLESPYVNDYINNYYKQSIIESMPNTTYVGVIGVVALNLLQI